MPTEKDPEPQLYRMKLWAEDDVGAKSRFWYFLKKYKKVKKANGQVIACNEVRLHERRGRAFDRKGGKGGSEAAATTSRAVH